MVEGINSDCWLLVIDTDSYSGNFERELTAYLTGQLGECGVGDKMANIFGEDAKKNKPPVDFDDIVISEPDDRGCHRPCTIYPTPGWRNDGMGGHYKVGDEVKALEEYKTRQLAEIASNRDRIKLYSTKPTYGWSEKDIRKELARLDKEEKEVKGRKKVGGFPAYRSVAIFFSERPSKKTIEWLKERAKGYPEARKKAHDWDRGPAPKITGWRLIEHKVVRTQKEEAV